MKARADAAVVIVRQSVQRRLSVAGKGRTVHQRQRPRREPREATDRPAHAGIEARILEHVLGGDGRPDDVAASVTAGPLPVWVKRSPHISVPVPSSKSTPASQPCGMCGVSK